MLLKDWQERALKTFVQAFFGVLIPEVCYILNNVSEIGSFSTAWSILFPAICAAISSGISAVWNIIKDSKPPVERITEADIKEEE